MVQELRNESKALNFKHFKVCLNLENFDKKVTVLSSCLRKYTINIG